MRFLISALKHGQEMSKYVIKVSSWVVISSCRLCHLRLVNNVDKETKPTSHPVNPKVVEVKCLHEKL